MRVYLKNIISKIPYPIGKMITGIPFSTRLGRTYDDFNRLIYESLNWSADEKMNYVIFHLNAVKTLAESKYNFYRKLYKDHGVFNQPVKDLSDWAKLPLVSKEDLRNHSSEFKGRYKINTGGTSGEPFFFYIDKHAWAREWAHMHYIWRLKGYNYTSIKIALRGKALGTEIFNFNPIHNEFNVNTYIDYSEIKNARAVKKLITEHKIKFVHGYPSALFTFFNELEKTLDRNEIEEIKSILKIAFLGSEFPIKYMMDYLTEKWNLDYISWYGHSEMCILAYDFGKDNHYHPFLTYGFTELEDNELVGSSFHNYDMPLLRYKTGDLVEAVYDRELIKSFRIIEGRAGDFVTDKLGKKISLTALIFGRHHDAFNVFDFVQIEELGPGAAKVYVTNKSGAVIKDISSYFDFTNVKIDFTFEELKEPVLSKAGKFKLKL